MKHEPFALPPLLEGFIPRINDADSELGNQTDESCVEVAPRGVAAPTYQAPGRAARMKGES